MLVVFSMQLEGTTMTTAYQQPSARPLRSLFFVLAVLVLGMALSASAPQTAVRTDGEEVFARVCATCHQVDPPADMQSAKPTAPPMKMIVRRYMMINETEEAAHARIVAWLKGPSAEKSLMPPHAITEHGLMPPVQLSEEERVAVASFVLGLLEAPMQGMGQGMGMMHQHGQADSTNAGQGMMNGMQMGLDMQGM